MLKKIIVVILLIMTILLCYINISFAARGWEDKFEVNDNIGDNGRIAKAGGDFIGMVRYIGIVIAVIMAIVLGIKYMKASPNEKADIIGKTLIYYVIGAVILFSTTWILTLIQSGAIETFK